MGNALDPTVFLFSSMYQHTMGEDVHTKALLEKRNYVNFLNPAEDAGSCIIIQEDTTAVKNISRILEKHADSEISIIHLIGDVEEDDQLVFDDLSAILGRYDKLKLVILSRCANLQLISSLLLRDIPAVISVCDELSSKEIFQTFYQFLAKGFSIKEAIAAIRDLEGEFGFYPATYQFEEDRIAWGLNAFPKEYKKAPSGIYALKDHLNKLEWRLPYAERLNRPKEENRFESPKSKRKLPVQIAASLGLLLLLTFGAAFMMQRNQPITREISQWNCEFPVNSIEQFNLVMLPITELGDCRSTDEGYAKLIERGLRAIPHEIPVATRSFEINVCKQLFPTSEKVLLDCKQTDLMVWGDIKPIGDSTQFALHYSLPLPLSDSLVRGTSTRLIPIDFRDIPKTNSIEEINGMIREVIGMAYFYKGRYEEALSYLEEIPLNEHEHFKPVAFAIAQSYAKLENFEKAEGYYSHVLKLDLNNIKAYQGRANIYVRQQKFDEAITDYSLAISLNPDFVDAIYNRGLVFLRLEMYKEAMEEMEKVLELMPANARANGIMAAIFAHNENEEDFYHHFEAFLKAGNDPGQLMRYTAVKNYQVEERFLNLLAQYNPDDNMSVIRQ